METRKKCKETDRYIELPNATLLPNGVCNNAT